MEPFLWVCLPALVAMGSALIAAYITQSRMEVTLARQREALTKVRTELACERKALAERLAAAEQAGRKKALDEFMAQLRVEERQYMRRNSSLLYDRDSMVIQQRLFFGNIPLTDWVEREFPFRQGIGSGAPTTARALVPARGGSPPEGG